MRRHEARRRNKERKGNTTESAENRSKEVGNERKKEKRRGKTRAKSVEIEGKEKQKRREEK